MTGPGDENAAGGWDRGRLRASRADREQAIATLKAAFIQGRLTRDEFDLRLGRVLGSRTYADLRGAGRAHCRPPRWAGRSDRP